MILLIGFILLGLGTALAVYSSIFQRATYRDIFPMSGYASKSFNYTLSSLLVTIGLGLIFIGVVFIV